MAAHWLKRWREIDGRGRAALVIAVVQLAKAYVDFRIRPTKAILDDLSRPQSPRPVSARRDPDLPHRIGWAIGVVAPRVPWRADCLVQAMAASAWLRRHGYGPVLQLGLQPSTGGAQALVAHAWLVLDGKVIVGGEDAGSRYIAIMRGDERAPPS